MAVHQYNITMRHENLAAKHFYKMMKFVAVSIFLTTFGHQVSAATTTAGVTGIDSVLLDGSGITTQVPDDSTDAPVTSATSDGEHRSTTLQHVDENTNSNSQSEITTVGPQDDIDEISSKAVNGTTDTQMNNTEDVLLNNATGNMTISGGDILLNDLLNNRMPLNVTDSPFQNDTTVATLPSSLVGLSCDVISELGSWSFDFIYKRADLEEVICRCEGLCEEVTLKQNVADFFHSFSLDPLSDANLKAFVSLLTVYSFILIFGVFGNIITLIGLSTWMKQKSPTYAFIMSLSCSDLLLLCVCLPLKVTEYFHLNAFTVVTCKGSYYIRDVMMICSVITQTVISFERYYAICKPFVVQYLCTWARARKIIVITWIVSFILASPTLVLMKLYVSITQQTEECLPQSMNTTYLILYFIYLSGILFALPSIIMGCTYGRSCHVLWRSTATAKKLKGQENKTDSELGKDQAKQDSEDIQSRKKVVRGLVCIYILFVICWGPSLIVQLLSGMGTIIKNRNKYRLAFETLTYFSSAVNPYMFMTISSQFCAPALACLFRRTSETNQEPSKSRATELTSNYNGPMPSSPSKY